MNRLEEVLPHTAKFLDAVSVFFHNSAGFIKTALLLVSLVLLVGIFYLLFKTSLLFKEHKKMDLKDLIGLEKKKNNSG